MVIKRLQNVYRCPVCQQGVEFHESRLEHGVFKLCCIGVVNIIDQIAEGISFLYFPYNAFVSINFYYISIFQNLGGLFSPDDCRNLKLSGNNCSMAQDASCISHNSTCFFHQRQEFRPSNTCDKDVALFKILEFRRIKDYPDLPLDQTPKSNSALYFSDAQCTYHDPF